ncbi:MFS transporter [Streptomyces xinghaiensis]|uniref:MFS transporter n=1 Tax=Streptomyces xinghaiensis TaxID=1038928 RepID=UPI002E15A394|nr:MFS transporter [Streptomyces xinghaiensis]
MAMAASAEGSPGHGGGASRGGPVLIGALVLDAVGNGLFLPLSLVYFLRLTDIPVGPLGVLISTANILTLPIPVWTGLLADRFGALPVVVASQVLHGLGYLAYGRADGPVSVFLAVTLVASGVRFFWSAVFTAIADYADGSRSALTKETWFGWATMARTAGFGAGGLLTGLVIADGRADAYRAVAYGAAGCFAVAALVIAVFVRAPGPLHRGRGDGGGEGGTGEAEVRAGGRADGTGAPRAGYRTLLRDGPFLALTGVNTIFAMTTMMLALALPTFVETGLHGPAGLTSAVLVGNTVLVALLAASVARRLAPYRRTRVLAAAAVLWAVWSFAYSGLVPDRPSWVFPLLAAATLLFTLAELMHAPISIGLATAVSPLAARGRYLAAYQYSFTFAGIVAPAFFTTLFELHRSLPWAALGAVNCLAAGAVLLLERHLPPHTLRSRPSSDAREISREP